MNRKVYISFVKLVNLSCA